MDGTGAQRAWPDADEGRCRGLVLGALVLAVLVLGGLLLGAICARQLFDAIAGGVASLRPPL